MLRIALDVRPTLAAGGEPYTVIMDAVKGLAPGEALALRSPFDPTPLHRVLAGLGFSRATRERGRRTGRPSTGARTRRAPRPRRPRPAPPEPIERTLAALESLPAGRALLQVNDRVPAFLLPLLDERGYRYRIGRTSAARW